MAISDPSAITQFTHPPKAKASASSSAAAAHAPPASSSTSAAAAAAAAAKQDSGRAQRPPPHVQKCHDLLKEMSKFPQVTCFPCRVQPYRICLANYTPTPFIPPPPLASSHHPFHPLITPCIPSRPISSPHPPLYPLSRLLQGGYFIEPVDFIKLNIPDYPNIIKHPMDFRTIKTNLDKNVYPTAEAFAQHVRLVFQNAIMYNQGREHPVHIAANILSSRFEERLRQMLVSLNRGTYPSEEAAPQLAKVQRQSSGGR